MTTSIILQACADEFQVTTEFLQSREQKQIAALPRNIYFDFCMLYQYDLNERHIDYASHVDRDTNTMYKGAKRAQQLKAIDVEVAAKWNRIQEKLNSFSHD